MMQKIEFDAEALQDEIDEAIQDSIDMDWTSAIGARHVMGIPVIAAVPDMVKALRAAQQFITNGIEFGYIQMPDPGTPDSAHDTLPMIDAVLRTIDGEG